MNVGSLTITGTAIHFVDAGRLGRSSLPPPTPFLSSRDRIWQHGGIPTGFREESRQNKIHYVTLKKKESEGKEKRSKNQIKHVGCLYFYILLQFFGVEKVREERDRERKYNSGKTPNFMFTGWCWCFCFPASWTPCLASNCSDLPTYIHLHIKTLMQKWFNILQ